MSHRHDDIDNTTFGTALFEIMKLLGFLLYTGIYIGLSRSECQDVSHEACVLMKQNKPNLCEDPTVSVSLCPKYCNKCPLSCYSCQEVGHPNDCHNVTTCQANEECLVGEVLTTDFNLKYRLGCVFKDVCTGLHLTEITGFGKRLINRKRALEVVCCSTDRCNRFRPIHHDGSPPTIITQITTPKTTTVGIVCQDDPTAACNGDTLQIVCGDFQLAQQFCPKSCEICSTKPTSHVATTMHITTVKPAPVITFAGVCQDDPSSTCNGDTLPIVCGDPQLANQFCAKSCGVCSTKPASHVATTMHITTPTPTPVRTVAGVCQDDPSSTCNGDTLPIVCGDPQLASQFCAKSCGVCSAVTTMHLVRTTKHMTSTTALTHGCADDPNSNCELAKDIVCADPEMNVKFCKKTCGLCT